MRLSRVKVQHASIGTVFKHCKNVNFESMIDNDRGSQCVKRCVQKCQSFTEFLSFLRNCFLHFDEVTRCNSNLLPVIEP